MAAPMNKRERKGNFSVTEERALLEAFSSRKGILFGKTKMANACKEKRTAWEEVAEAVNSVGAANRTKEECKAKVGATQDSYNNNYHGTPSLRYF